MRLIDADYLNEILIKRREQLENRYGSLAGAAEGCHRLVGQAPTVESAPVVHGRWESFTTSAFVGSYDDGEPKWADRRFYVHKECGRRSAIKEKYCPLCGAKMDKENDND